MSSLNLDENNAQYQVRGYAPGTIKINDKTFNHSVIISPTTLIEPWTPQSAEDISTESFESIIALKPDVLLIGTGAQLIFLSAEQYGHLINLGIGVEIMDTSAACRTYNALSAEGRNVIAALIIR